MLSKSDFLSGYDCPKRLWLCKNRPGLAAPLSEAQQRRMRQGREITELARTYFAGGVLIDAVDADTAVAQTKAAIDSGAETIFEAAFIADELFARADIVTRAGQAWNVIEVKSSGEAKDEHLVDIAFQAHTVIHAGFAVQDVSLMLLNKAFISPNVGSLFVNENKTQETAGGEPTVGAKASQLVEVMAQQSEPMFQIGSHCCADGDCPFKNYCWSHVPKHSVCSIPGLYWKKKQPLIEKGIINLSELPPDVNLNTKQRDYVQAALSGVPVIDKESIHRELSKLSLPIYFFDIETDAPAVPRYEGMHPHEKFPFQFSCHILDKDGNISHREFLHLDATDPRLPFIQALLEVVGTTGSIVVYHASFEGTELNRLAAAFPQYAQQLTQIVGRFWDEEQIFLKHYMHPDFYGRTSIKVVLPALVPSLSYKALSIQSGDNASAAWNHMIECENVTEKEGIASDLKEYCKLDTLAMVEIYWHLQGIVDVKPWK